MAVVLSNAYVLIGSTDLSDHVKQVELSQTVDMQDATAMGASQGFTKISAPGLKDWSLKITFHQDFATSKVDQTFSPMIGGSTTFEIRPTPSPRSATNPGWTGTGVLSSYNPVAGSVGDEQLASVQLEAGSQLVRNIV